MPTFDVIPSYAIDVETTPRVRVARFGDGYEQRAAEGINRLPRRWSLRFVRHDDELDAIEAFLAARGGVEAFDWTPPKGAAGKWVCRSWRRSLTQPGFGEISCTFEEVWV
jgi:phage-related protein